MKFMMVTQISRFSGREAAWKRAATTRNACLVQRATIPVSLATRDIRRLRAVSLVLELAFATFTDVEVCVGYRTQGVWNFASVQRLEAAQGETFQIDFSFDAATADGLFVGLGDTSSTLLFHAIAVDAATD
jgi:hypothetical protein